MRINRATFLPREAGEVARRVFLRRDGGGVRPGQGQLRAAGAAVNSSAFLVPKLNRNPTPVAGILAAA